MNCEQETSSLSDWKRQLLADQGISMPDGRPLYAYRLTEQRFETLESKLRSKLDDHLKYNSLGVLSDSDYHFCALFILYAAEWWRRRYEGSRWSWEPILSSLGITHDSWSATQRNECIERGLRGWNDLVATLRGNAYGRWYHTKIWIPTEDHGNQTPTARELSSG